MPELNDGAIEFMRRMNSKLKLVSSWSDVDC